MKFLLDENLPHQLRHELAGHDCFTVAYMGWGGVENGALLALAASHGFHALLTKDANMEYEHLPTAVMVIVAASNDIHDIRPLLPKLLTTLERLPTKCVTRVP
jgi:hypothetical protein